MNSSQPTLRQGRPAFFAEAGVLIYESSHELLDFLLSDRGIAERVLAKLYRKSVGHFSFRFSTAAVVEDRMVGLELGYDRDQLGRQAAIGGLLMLLNSPVSLWWHLIAKASRVIDGYVPKPSEGAYYINNIAVSSARRGTGIGMLLLANAIDRARRTGYHRVELDVTSVNEGAIGFYRKHGFVAVSQSGGPGLQERFGLPPLIRMTHRLS